MPLWTLGFSPGVGTGLAGERRGQERGLTWSHPLGGSGGFISFSYSECVHAGSRPHPGVLIRRRVQGPGRLPAALLPPCLDSS